MELNNKRNRWRIYRTKWLATRKYKGLFNLSSTITVECCVLFLCCVGVFGMFTVMQGRIIFSSVFAITERRDMVLYEVPMYNVFTGFWDGDYVGQLPYVWYYVIVKNIFIHSSSRGPMCFRLIMFSLSGPCELLFLLCFIASWRWVVVSVM